MVAVKSSKDGIFLKTYKVQCGASLTFYLVGDYNCSNIQGKDFLASHKRAFTIRVYQIKDYVYTWFTIRGVINLKCK